MPNATNAEHDCAVGMADALTFAILAGGAATRLGGRDKGLELLGGRPLVAWVIAAITAMEPATPFDSAPITPPRLLIVANRHHDEYTRYAPTLADCVPGLRGPLAGISTALAACQTPWLLTLPVDCPRPPLDLAARLLRAAVEGDERCVVAHDGSRRQPLFAIYRTALAAASTTGVVAGQGVWSWQDAIGVRELDFSDRRRQFENLNTPEEFAAYVEPVRSTR